jgi:hypothetical protein
MPPLLSLYFSFSLPFLSISLPHTRFFSLTLSLLCSVTKAAAYLLAKQNPNGGWGESYLACVNKEYPEHGAGEVRFSEN